MAFVCGETLYAAPYTRTITDAAGHQEAWTYDDIVGVPKVVEKLNLVDGKTEENQYDLNGNLVYRRDPEGRATSYTYNEHNQSVGRTEAPGTANERTTTYEYLSPELDLVTRVVMSSVRDGMTREVVNVYDENLNRTSRTEKGFDPAGNLLERTTQYEFNDMGQVVVIDGPRIDVEDAYEFRYYECSTGGACGQVFQVINPLGHVTTYDSYDAAGNLTQMTDANGTVVRYAYDSRMRLVSETRIPVGDEQVSRTTRYFYDALGQLIEVSWPDGGSVRYEYDDSRYLRAIVDEVGNRQLFDYDLKGNPVRKEIVDPADATVSRFEIAYDHRDHVIEFNEAGSVTRMINDAAGRTTSLFDANQNFPATFEHDSLNRLAAAVDPLEGITAYAYDMNDRVKEVVAPNGSTTGFAYDDLGNLLEEISADRGRTTYRHDEAGNRIEQRDARGEVIRFQYDELDRLIAVDYHGEAHDQSFEWDTCENGIGRICVIRDESGITEYEYGPFGNVLSETRTDNAGRYVTSYEWDHRDRLASMTYPNGRKVSWGRDNAGRIVSMSSVFQGDYETIVDSVDYRADGLVTSQVFGNGVGETREYDLRGKLLSQQIGLEDHRHYSYDANGNVLSMEQREVANYYVYDALNRLTAESRVAIDDSQSVSESKITLWDYDANGNRILQTKGEGAGAGCPAGEEENCDTPCVEPSAACMDGDFKERQYSYAPHSNRMVSNGKKTVVLDVAGYTISDGSGKKEYRYNAAHRLFEYFGEGVRKARYAYNAKNQRTGKILYEPDGVTIRREIRYIYDLDGQLISEFINGEPIRDYLWMEDAAVRQDKLGTDENGMSVIKQRLTVISDHLNTPRVAYDEQQDIVWRWDSNGFGKGGVNRDADGDGKKRRVRLRFPGQYWDKESGLYYNHHRYYDPGKGRYVTSDPIGLGGGLNTYGYVYQNPLSWFDVRGLEVVGRFVRDVLRLTYLTATGPWESIYPGELKGPLPRVSMWNVDTEFGGSYGMLVHCKETECGAVIREGYAVETEYAGGLEHTFTIHLGVMGRTWARLALGAGMIYAEHREKIDSMIRTRAALRLGAPTMICKRNSYWYPNTPNYFDTLSDAPL